jgi:hypothetical protein
MFKRRRNSVQRPVEGLEDQIDLLWADLHCNRVAVRHAKRIQQHEDRTRDPNCFSPMVRKVARFVYILGNYATAPAA